MARTVNLTLNDLTLNEANLILFALDATRSGKVVELNVLGDPHGPECASGACDLPAVSEPVAIDTPYKPNDEAVEATYEVKKPKKTRGKGKPKKAAPAEDPSRGEDPTLVAPALPEPIGPEDTKTATIHEVVAIPSLTKVDVDAALDLVFKKSGMTGAKAILTEFSAVRSRDLKPEQYQKFIARANEIASR